MSIRQGTHQSSYHSVVAFLAQRATSFFEIQQTFSFPFSYLETYALRIASRHYLVHKLTCAPNSKPDMTNKGQYFTLVNTGMTDNKCESFYQPRMLEIPTCGNFGFDGFWHIQEQNANMWSNENNCLRLNQGKTFATPNMTLLFSISTLIRILSV